MTITARLQLSDGSYADDPNILVAGFKGDECRGIASPDPDENPVLDGLIYLSIGSNESSGEMITFKAYLPDEGIIVDLDQELEFIANIGHGTIAEPFVFTFETEEIDLEIVSVEALADITVAYGTALEDVPLPEMVEVTLDNGSTTDLDVPGMVAHQPTMAKRPAPTPLKGRLPCPKASSTPQTLLRKPM